MNLLRSIVKLAPLCRLVNRWRCLSRAAWVRWMALLARLFYPVADVQPGRLFFGQESPIGSLRTDNRGTRRF